jgi:hypothetical protein
LQVIKGAKNLLQKGRISDCVFEEHLDYLTYVTTYLEVMGYRVLRIHRKFIGLDLLDPASQAAPTHWLPTSCVATRNPERLIGIFQKPGWQIFQ